MRSLHTRFIRSNHFVDEFYFKLEVFLQFRSVQNLVLASLSLSKETNWGKSLLFYLLKKTNPFSAETEPSIVMATVWLTSTKNQLVATEKFATVRVSENDCNALTKKSDRIFLIFFRYQKFTIFPSMPQNFILIEIFWGGQIKFWTWNGCFVFVWVI